MLVGSMLELPVVDGRHLCCHNDKQYAHALHNTFGPSPLLYSHCMLYSDKTYRIENNKKSTSLSMLEPKSLCKFSW